MHCSELVDSKNYFNLTKIFLRLSKIDANQIECIRLEKKCLEADKCKPSVIYRGKCDVLGEACFSKKSLKWAKHKPE